MKKLLSTVLCGLFVLCASAKDFELPMPSKSEGNWNKRMNHFMWENKKIFKGGVVMLGDSITQGFPIHKAPKEWKLVNRGIGGDCIGGWKYQGAIDRVEVSIDAVEPKKVFIALGTNDIIDWFPELQSAPQKEMAKGYVALIKAIKKNNPDVKVYIQSVPPVDRKFSKFNEDIVAFNKKLQYIAKKMNLEYVDTHSLFVGENGALQAKFSRDGVHLKQAAYDVWIKALKPYMED